MGRTAAAIAACLVLSLAGCGGGVEADKTAATTATSAAAQPAAEPVEEEATTTTDDEVARIGGESFTYEDGIKVRVLSAKVVRRSAYAAGGKRGQPVVVVKVQLVNGSSSSFDATLATVALRAGTDGNEADDVFQDGVDSSFDGDIAPGRKATATFAFGVNKGDLDQLNVAVAPSWEHEESLFEGSAG